MGMVSVGILCLNDGLGARGGAKSWKCIASVMRDRQNRALNLSPLREGISLLDR